MNVIFSMQSGGADGTGVSQRSALRGLDNPRCVVGGESRAGAGSGSCGAGVTGAASGLDLQRVRLLSVGNELPVAPRILAQVGRRMQEMETDLEDLAALLKLDSGITAAVLRVANTAAYNPHEAFVNLEEALARLGFAKVYRLMGIVALRQVSEQDLYFYGITGAQFRQNALLTALIAELVSQVAGACPQGAYTLGLLRSIGKLALDLMTRRAGVGWDGDVDAETEQHLFGMRGFEASALLLEAWGFASETVRAMREMAEAEPVERLAEVLQLSAGLAERAGYGLPGETFEWALTPGKLEFLGLTGPAVEEAVKRALKQFLAVRGAIL